ncbi:MAG: replication initiator protein A [Lachnospiraceae bacterium]|nr:replication initiator protein A [Lachnospiraceae bacterium]
MQKQIADDRIRKTEPEQHGIGQIPKMFYAEQSCEISPLSRQLYEFLLHRICLIEKYGWEDREGRRYVYCTIRQISEELGCSIRTAGKLMEELQNQGLLEKKRQGQGKPNRIYLKSPGDVFSGRKEKNE